MIGRLTLASALMAPGLASAQNTALHLPPEIWAAEDIPLEGTDADTNDVVVRHASRCVYSPGYQLISQTIHVEAVAAGASYTNRLELSPGWTATSVTIRRGGGAPETLAPDGSGWYTLYANVDTAFVGAPSGFVNTEEGAATIAGVPAIVEVTYAPGFVGSPCPEPAFSVRHGATRIETASTLPSNGQPLAARLPEDWLVPVENVDIATAYPRFLSWVASLVGDCTPGLDCVDEDWSNDPVPSDTIPRPDLVADALDPLPTCSDGLQNGDETYADCGGSICGSCWEDCDGDPVDVSGLVVVEFAGNLTQMSSSGAPTGLFAVPEVITGWYAYDPTAVGTDMSSSYGNQPVRRYAGPARTVVRHGPSGGPFACQDSFSGGRMQLEDRPAGAGVGSDVYYVESSTSGGTWALQFDFYDYGADAGLGTFLTEFAPPPFDGDARIYLQRGTYPNQDRASGPTTTHRCATCRQVFGTSDRLTADLGGIGGADAKCQADADAAGREGTYLAWLGTGSGLAPSNRFTRSTTPYVRTDGAKVADDWADLTDGTLDAAISRSATGSALPVTWPPHTVWTNVDTSGDAYASDDCAGWTTASMASSARVGGTVYADANWTGYSSYACGNTFRLYCFQQ